MPRRNEILDGFHFRHLPLPDVAAARRAFARLVDEATRWKGEPVRTESSDGRQLVAWPDLELRQAGRGVLVQARAPWFDRWWHSDATWDGEPMKEIWEWLGEGRSR